MVGEIIGYLALVLNLVALLMPNRKKLLGVQIAASVMFVGHYSVLGALSGALQESLKILRNAAFINAAKLDLSNQKIFIIISVIALLLLVPSWSGWISVLPVVATLSGTYARSQKNLEKLLLLGLVSTCLLLLYAILINSIPAILSYAIQLVVTSVALLRAESRFHVLANKFVDWHIT